MYKKLIAKEDIPIGAFVQIDQNNNVCVIPADLPADQIRIIQCADSVKKGEEVCLLWNFKPYSNPFLWLLVKKDSILRRLNDSK